MPGVPISKIVRVSLESTPSAIKDINMNIVCIITDSNKVLSTSERTRAYKSLSSVASDFGTNSREYQGAKALFSQSSNPVSKGGGYLVIGYWRAKSETIEAQAGYLIGKSLSEKVILGALQSVSKGGISIKIDDNAIQTIENLDFTTCTSLADIIALLKSKITGANVFLNGNNQIIIESQTKGVTSKVSFADNVDGAEEIASILTLSSGSGAVIVNGTAEKVLTAETKEEALNEIRNNEDIKGFVFLDKPTSDEAKAISSWAKANDVISYDVFSNDDNLQISKDNFAWNNKQEGGINYRTLFNKDGDRNLAIAYMARMHSINFNGDRVAITMEFKELSGFEPIDLNENEVDKCKKIGFDFYTTIGGKSVLYTSGENGYMDNVYNSIAIKKYVQLGVMNALITTANKLPQTDEGIRALTGKIEMVLSKFVKAGVIDKGTWNSTDTFGNDELFRRSIENVGYFVHAQSVREQSQADREERKAPLIQVAFKMAGAIQGADITINFEK